MSARRETLISSNSEVIGQPRLRGNSEACSCFETKKRASKLDTTAVPEDHFLQGAVDPFEAHRMLLAEADPVSTEARIFLFCNAGRAIGAPNYVSCPCGHLERQFERPLTWP